jgi:hypothetical protein
MKLKNLLKSDWFLSLGFAVLVCLLWQTISGNIVDLHFPLDDAWIHQTYARNLAKNLSWDYVPGNKSAGSTAPFWTFWLSIGYFGKLNAGLLWTFVSSVVLLSILGVLIFRASEKLSQQIFPLWFILVGLLEWHLVWAACSGMETILFCILISAIFYLLLSDHRDWIWIGLICGLSIWIRPDGITLLGPILLVMIFSKESTLFGMKLLRFLIPFLLLVLLYCEFNWWIGGTIFPNTYFAKQAEYEVLTQTPFIERFVNLIKQPFIGVLFFCIPGIIYQLIISIRKRNIPWIGFFCWVVGFVILYCIRLPVTYQHGRYLIPIIPFLLISGVAGSWQLTNLDKNKKNHRLATFCFVVLLAFALIGFQFIGIKTFQTDLNIIDTLMVDPAQWIERNTPTDALIAAHHIGALGYFSHRDILDLAGLISPEVIPIISDQARMQQFVLENDADYLYFSPSWYPGFISLGNISYQTPFVKSGDQVDYCVIVKLHKK